MSNSRGEIPSTNDEDTKVIRDIIDSLNAERGKLPTAAGLEVYNPRTTDVIISSYPKSGTTFTQQMVYQVCVFGGGPPKDDPEGQLFSDISEKVPWLNYINVMGITDESMSFPRVFKTHSPAQRFKPNAQKHIVVIRNPSSFPSSYLDFIFSCYGAIWMKNHIRDNKNIKQGLFDDAYEKRILGTTRVKIDVTDAFDKNCEDGDKTLGPWFKWTKGWVERSKDYDSVMLMFYEDMVADTARCVRRVASFLNKTLANDSVKEICCRCSREYMLGDERFLSKWDGKYLHRNGIAPKVLPEKREGFKSLSCSDRHLEETRTQMKRALGHDTYEKFKSSLECS